LRCYICDFSDNGQQSDYHAGLSSMNFHSRNKVKEVECGPTRPQGQYICEQCLSSCAATKRQTERVHNPLDPKNYNYNVDQLLREFKEDLPILYDLLGVDVSHQGGHSALDSSG
jgi:hypothetical protein